MKKNPKFKWKVLTWDINNDCLESYDVVPQLIAELRALKPAKRPKTKEELSEILDEEARYHYWAKCEYEVIVNGLFSKSRSVKIDVYEQLKANWDNFIDAFWSNVFDERKGK